MPSSPPASDCRIVCAALPPTMCRALLSAFPEAVLLDSQPDAPETMDICRALAAELLVVDARQLPGIRKLRILAGETRPLVLGIAEEPTDSVLRSAARAGCSGLIAQGDTVATVRRAVERMLLGELWFPRVMLSEMARSGLEQAAVQRLTAREQEILRLLGSNENNQAIADRLFISRETVRWHLRGLYPKIGATSREAAQQYARNTLGATAAGPKAPEGPSIEQMN